MSIWAICNALPYSDAGQCKRMTRPSLLATCILPNVNVKTEAVKEPEISFLINAQKILPSIKLPYQTPRDSCFIGLARSYCLPPRMSTIIPKFTQDNICRLMNPFPKITMRLGHDIWTGWYRYIVIYNCTAPVFPTGTAVSLRFPYRIQPKNSTPQ